MGINKECVSSLPVTFIYRYIFIPMFLLFIGAGIYIALLDSSATLVDYLFLFVILATPVFFAIYVLNKVKTVFVDSEGIYYKEHFIQWTNVMKIKFYFISPPIMIVKYVNGVAMKHSIWCILPLTKYKYVKELILTLKKNRV